MKPELLLVLLSLGLGGCREREVLPHPLKPTKHVRSRLAVPRLDPAAAGVVAVDIWVPDGYEMQLFENEAVFRRNASDPTIDLWSLETAEGLGGPIEPRHTDRDCRQMESGRVMQTAVRDDGWVVVCRSTVTIGDPLAGDTRDKTMTRVVRDLHAVGNEFQCVVDFRDGQVASKSRITDAVAICDTMSPREIREDEKHQSWNGSRWVKYSTWGRGGF